MILAAFRLGISFGSMVCSMDIRLSLLADRFRYSVVIDEVHNKCTFYDS
jgi:hypothetical protein